MTTRTTKIEAGIEYYDVLNAQGHVVQSGEQCARCGSSVEWLAGEPHCLSSRAWCDAHQMPGREHIPSTALNPEAWRDA